MATGRNAWRNLMDSLLTLKQEGEQGVRLGKLKEVREGFDSSSEIASEDARRSLYRFREAQGLDEPPQLVEQSVRSGAIDAIREVASAYLNPKGALKDIGFSDEMLKHRQEMGQSIVQDPTFFDRAINAARKEKTDRLKGTLAEFDQTYDGQLMTLSPAEYEGVVAQRAEELRRAMREQSVLKKVGRATGVAFGEVGEDRTRALWWLLNAPQAVTSVAADLVVSKGNPNVRTRRTIMPQDFRKAAELGLLRKVGNAPLMKSQRSDVVENALTPQQQDIINDFTASDDSHWLNADNYKPAKAGVLAGYDDTTKQHVFTQRRMNPNAIAWAGLGGTALATNAGLGLVGTEDTGVVLGGRREGYAAAAPDSEDKRKSASPLQELATKYFLSRDGNLLPKREFLLERPDVSGKQFAQYNAYKNDKNLDLNPFDDGKFNLGVLKGTSEGIHGPEAQFLGQTLSLNEAGVPILGALAGTALGALGPNIRQLRLRKHAVKDRLNQKGMLHTYKQPQGFVEKVAANIPDVRRKTWDETEDSANPWIKPGSQMDKLTKAYENYFTKPNEVTGKRDMDGFKTALSLAGGAGAGVLAGTTIGATAEEDRRRKNFESWAAPGVSYDQVKKDTRNLLNTMKEQEAKLPQSEKDKYKYPSQLSAAIQKENLTTNMIGQQAIVNEIITNEKDKRKAEAALAQQQKILSDLNALYAETS